MKQINDLSELNELLDEVVGAQVDESLVKFYVEIQRQFEIQNLSIIIKKCFNKEDGEVKVWYEAVIPSRKRLEYCKDEDELFQLVTQWFLNLNFDKTLNFD